MSRSRTAIRLADELIEEAKHRFVTLDRELAKLQRLRPRAASAALRELRARRDESYRTLVELIDLAQMPVEYMGWA